MYSHLHNGDLDIPLTLAGYTNPYPFRILDLPVELITEIALWAQLIWQDEVLPIRVPQMEVKRLPIGTPVSVRRETCCRGLHRSIVPRCTTLWTPPATLSPARCMAQTCKRLRVLLLHDNSHIWVYDNALYKRLGAPTDTGGSGAGAVQNVAENLVVLEACIHTLRPVKLRFTLVRNARLALPWDDPQALTRVTEEFFLLRHLMQSPLQHLDLEIYNCSRAREQPDILNVRIDSLQTYRALNSSVVFYSQNLTTLEISHPYSRRPRFNGTFFDALSICASTLQHLSIDAPRATFSGAGHIDMPELRYLRLVAESSCDTPLLRALVLPATVDIHLEPAVNWRREAFDRRELTPPTHHGVPFADLERLHGGGNNPHELWRYMGALAAPDELAGVFRKPAQFTVRDEGLWSTMTAVGLDIRLDPSTEPLERAARRFPEYVSVAFASSNAEMVRMQRYPGHDGRRSTSPQGKLTARRSLSVRDSGHRPRERESMLVPSMPAPLFDCVRYIMTTALRGKPGSSFVGAPSVRDLCVHPHSWLPTFTMGWDAIFGEVGIMIERIEFGCPFLSPILPPPANSEGYLTPTHLDSFARYLDDFSDPLRCPCPGLNMIGVQSALPGESRDAAVARLEAQFNSIRRLNSGAPRIAFVVGEDGPRRRGAGAHGDRG